MNLTRENVARTILLRLRDQVGLNGDVELIVWAALTAGSENIRLFRVVVLGFCEAMKESEP